MITLKRKLDFNTCIHYKIHLPLILFFGLGLFTLTAEMLYKRDSLVDDDEFYDWKLIAAFITSIPTFLLFIF